MLVLQKKFLITIALTGLLAGCGEEDTRSNAISDTNSAAASQDGIPTDDTQALEENTAAAVTSASFIWSGDSMPESIGADVEVSALPSGVEVVQIGNTADSKALTTGAAFEIGRELEQQFSGREIEVVISGQSNSVGDIWAAYSTNEVGNSGWRVLEVPEGQFSVSFTYTLNPLLNGRNDYVGILPGSVGEAIQLDSISVQTVE